MSRITAVKHMDGTIVSYKTDDGKVINKEQVVSMADSGELEGVSSFETRAGDRAIRSDRGQYNYSLDDLPEF